MDQGLVKVSHAIVSQRECLQLSKLREAPHIADIIVVEDERLQVDKLLQLSDITVGKNKTNIVKQKG